MAAHHDPFDALVAVDMLLHGGDGGAAGRCAEKTLVQRFFSFVHPRTISRAICG